MDRTKRGRDVVGFAMSSVLKSRAGESVNPIDSVLSGAESMVGGLG